MTASYRWVQWNRHKKVYDSVLAGGIVAFLAIFMGSSVLFYPAPGEISVPVLLIRAFGSLAVLMLHVILCIGPLARLSDLFAPLLYNRRHLGVAFFFVAFGHALIAVLFYGGFGVRDPVSAVVAGYGGFGSISSFPFEFLGAAALCVFFAMAATSHDFWLANLGARTWKTLHMLVYVSYGLVVLHVVLGALQSERHPMLAAGLVGGVGLVSGLHVVAALVQARRDEQTIRAPTEGAWLDVCGVGEIEDGAAKIVRRTGEESIAVIRDGDSYCAMSNVCAHQGGPLGEGRIVDGCMTCPWHGYQYRPSDGRSPPPYTEKVATYNVRVVAGRVQVDADANEPGTPTTPARAGAATESGREVSRDAE
ncbi:MAG: Rieske 2Fe-2S domain-containing protein [Phycisphaerales bacterium JB041]